MNQRLWCARLAAGAVLASAAMVPASAQAAGFGSLNAGFGTGGTVAAPAQLVGVTTGPSGEVVAVGQAGGKIFVQKTSATGAAEGTYTGPTGVARAVVVQSNGDVVIAGSDGGPATQSYNQGSFFVERLTPSLTPDSSFGSGGIATAFSGQPGIANAVALTPSGAIVAGGAVNPPNTSAAVAQFTANGTLDSSFGSGGTTTIAGNFTAGGGGYGAITGITVLPGGTIAYAGTQQNVYNVTQGVVGELNPNGSNNSTFASSGPFHYSPPGGSSGYTAFTSIAPAPGGQVIVGGVDQGGENALVLRYNANGSPDSSFANGGLATVKAVGNAAANSAVGADGVALAGGNTIIASGQYEATATNYSGALYGLTNTGALNPAFGTNGGALGPVGSSATPYEGCGMTVAPDGTIYTVGYSPTQTPDPTPCATGAGTNGYIASFTGNGAPPALTGAAPQASTGGATAASPTSETLTGTVNPEGAATSFYVKYGTTAAYGLQTPAVSAESGTSPVDVIIDLHNLTPSTTYHYEIVATNANGTTTGKDATFTTQASVPTPYAFTGVSQNVGETSAKVFGRVNPKGAATQYFWEFDWTTKYRRHTATFNAGSGTATKIYSANFTHLAPGHVYHYRLVAMNVGGTSYGQDRTFKTAPALKASVGAVHTTTLPGRRLVLHVSCNQVCGVKGQLVLWRSWSQRLGLGNHYTTLATKSTTFRYHRSGTVVLYVSPHDYAALTRGRGAGANLQVTFTPPAGGPAVTVKEKVTIDA